MHRSHRSERLTTHSTSSSLSETTTPGSSRARVGTTANAPIDDGGIGLQMINYYDGKSWSRLPVPSSIRIESVCWDGKAFVFRTSRGPIRSTARQVWLAVQDSMTGRGS